MATRDERIKRRAIADGMREVRYIAVGRTTPVVQPILYDFEDAAADLPDGNDRVPFQLNHLWEGLTARAQGGAQGGFFWITFRTEQDGVFIWTTRQFATIQHPGETLLIATNRLMRELREQYQVEDVMVMRVVFRKAGPPYTDRQRVRVEGPRAFKPIDLSSFQRETLCSILEGSEWCIYESFVVLQMVHIDKLDPKKWSKGKRRMEKLRERMLEEPEEVQRLFRYQHRDDRRLYTVLKLLCKHHEFAVQVFWRDYPSRGGGYYRCDLVDAEGNLTHDIGDDEVDPALPSMLYQHEHVAPYRPKRSNPITNPKARYQLKPERLEELGEQRFHYVYWDLETLGDGVDVNDFRPQVVFHASVWLPEGERKMSWYGLDAIRDFVDWIDTLVEVVHTTKNHSRKIKKHWRFVSHNGSSFDNLFIWKEFYRRHPATEFLFSSSSLKWWKYHNIEGVDFCLMFPEKLRDLAKSFDIPMQKTYYPYLFPRKDNLDYVGEVPGEEYWEPGDYEAFMAEWEGGEFSLEEVTTNYCERDCEVLGRIHQKFLNETLRSTERRNGRIFNGEKCWTASGLSKALFQQCYLEEELYAPEQPAVDAWREAFYGGRTEVFQLYCKNAYYIDANSMYPTQMLEDVPVKLSYGGHVKVRDWVDWSRWVEINPVGVYYAKVYDPNLIPHLPMRRERGSNYYPRNSEGWRVGVELIHCIKTNCRVEIRESWDFEGRPIFKKYCEDIYEHRLQAKRDGNEVAQKSDKLTMNGLFGKFGQRAFPEQVVCDLESAWELASNPDYYNFELSDEFDDGMFIVSYDTDKKNAQSIGLLVGLAATITARGRCSLAEAKLAVGQENVVYCDTDSIVTTKEPPEEMIGKQLGEWDYECNKIEEGWFHAPKVYDIKPYPGPVVQPAGAPAKFKRIRHCKGVNTSALSDDLFDALANDEPFEVVNRNTFNRSMVDGVKIGDQPREITRVLNKRKFNSDGRSEPLNE